MRASWRAPAAQGKCPCPCAIKFEGLHSALEVLLGSSGLATDVLYLCRSRLRALSPVLLCTIKVVKLSSKSLRPLNA